MKKTLFFALTIFSTFTLSAQNNLKKGYYIDISGHRNDGYINVSGLGSLNEVNSEIEFSPQPDGATSPVNTKTISEIGVENSARLIKYEIQLDDTNYRDISNTNKYPQFAAAIVFVKVLLDGKASLLAYEGHNGTKYFYMAQGGKPQQLMYKKYNENGVVRENASFRQFLYDNMKSGGMAFGKFSELNYNEEDLLRIFEAFNTSQHGESQVFKTEEKSWPLHWAIMAGVYNTDAKFERDDNNIYSTDDSSVAYDIAIEVEYLPSGKSLGFFGVLGCEILNSKFEVENPSAHTSVNDKIKSPIFDIGAGVRYHFGLSKKSGLFVDAALVYSISSSIDENVMLVSDGGEESSTSRQTYDTSNSFIGIAGAGFIFSEKYGLALRYETPRVILDKQQGKISYGRIGVQFRYIFN